MTSMTSSFGSMKISLAGLPAGVLVVASQSHLSVFSGGLSDFGFGEARMQTLEADAPVTSEMLDRVWLLVLEVDPADHASLERLAQLRVTHPNLSIIVALRDASVSLVRTLIRQGVADVAQLPFQPETLAAQILDALSAQTERVSTGHLAPMIAVVGATGGAGATTALTHIANALAEANTGMRGVCLIDLDLQGGDVASYLGATPKVTIDELLDAGSRMDADLFRSAVVEARRGLSLVAAPPDIKPMDRVDTDDLLALVKLARSLFDYVLVDLPPVWNSWSLSVVNSADRVVLVSDASINCLRQAKRRMRLFDEIDFPSAKVDVVINRMERKLFRPVSEDAMADALGVAIAGTLPLDGQGISAAQDEGRLVTENGSKSRYGSQTDALAHAIVQRLQGE